MLKTWLIVFTEPVVVIIDGMALLIVAVASVHAFLASASLFWGELRGHTVDGHARRTLWLTYGRWLVAALTFQLAADIIESSIAPTWKEVGMLGAVAVIRTFLNYFLERDIDELREREGRARLVPATSADPASPVEKSP
ncbi:MAG TPA: DUF1622 domain-containing protein [Stenotrophomonas sp.]|nr:DUF1622 domain-containing protein [Stenotrophomonas sp.]